MNSAAQLWRKYKVTIDPYVVYCEICNVDDPYPIFGSFVGQLSLVSFLHFSVFLCQCLILNRQL